MTRIRIIIPAATIERTKLYLIRGAALLLCVLIFPLAAHASPFDSGISSIQTLFTGTVAKAASLIAIVIGGYETNYNSHVSHDTTGTRNSSTRASLMSPSPALRRMRGFIPTMPEPLANASAPT
jgi:type IV secretory pathway VirB2 component (pilin)